MQSFEIAVLALSKKYKKNYVKIFLFSKNYTYLCAVNITTMNKKETVKAFKAELQIVLPLLPTNYAAILSHTKGFERRRLYRVKNYGTVDAEILDAMKELINPAYKHEVSDAN